ncbi:hypothetical protein DSO57_1033382 [Entomophthora muscae]|uniref:Uncharacterized protein n=1 Tax=Entomophthora muscae TaxID=34485 RepID=A0ACC2UAI3_9FUNG|nr:hypothetical protein DSO57_1033382 [Entomophthora muscae]
MCAKSKFVWTPSKTFKIDNCLSLETQAQGRDSNHGPDFPQAATPKDQWASQLRFLEIKHPQTEAKHESLDDNDSQALETDCKTKD